MGELIVRTATREDAAALDAVIRAHQIDSDLPPRDVEEIQAHAERFIVCDENGVIRACAELAPLSARTVELRSMAVDRDTPHIGVLDRLVGEVRARARKAGFESLSVFTNDARVFIQHNFSIVPHVWLPEKLLKDGYVSPSFERHGRYAMLLPLAELPRYGSGATLPRHAAVA